MLELVAGAAIAIAVLALVVEPLTRTRTATATGAADVLHEDDPFAPLEESESPKVQALLALKEIEFDRATGKLSDDDYASLRGRYAQRVMEAIKAEEAEQAAERVAETAVAAEDPAEALIEAVRSRARACPACGPRPETDAAFCSDCGRALT